MNHVIHILALSVVGLGGDDPRVGSGWLRISDPVVVRAEARERDRVIPRESPRPTSRGLFAPTPTPSRYLASEPIVLDPAMVPGPPASVETPPTAEPAPFTDDFRDLIPRNPEPVRYSPEVDVRPSPQAPAPVAFAAPTPIQPTYVQPLGGSFAASPCVGGSCPSPSSSQPRGFLGRLFGR